MHQTRGEKIGALLRQWQHFGTIAVRLVEPSLQALQLRAVDDAGEVGIAVPVGVVLVKPSLCQAQKFIQLMVLQQHIIRRNTGLPCIDHFAIHDALHGFGQIGIAGNDDRRFAAQFQSHGREVIGRGTHHVFAHGGRAGEEQVVKWQGRKSRCHFHAASNYRQLIGLKVLRHQAGHGFGKLGDMLRDFHHGAVAGHKSIDQRPND